MKCANCGEEIEEGMRFCGTCGAPVPQEKACVSCGAKIPLKMKFCPECGAPQDGSRPKAAAAIAMGDKNVIAGDVIGRKEEMNISGNATIIKNEDQTKQVRKCHVCGKMVQITQGFECPECGEFTCENCYDSDSGLCKSCAAKKTSGKVDKYRSAVKEALADGRIDFADRRKLDTLQRELGMNRDEALAIEAEEKNGGVTAKSVGSGLSSVEQVEFENIAEQFYNCIGIDDALLARIEKLYSAHRTDEKVLGLYLPMLAATKGGAKKALGIIKSLPVDVLGVYIAAVDIFLEQGDLAQTENYINRAKAIGQDDPLVLCREAYLKLAMYKQYNRKDFLDSADSIAQTVSTVQTQDKIVKSHQVRLAELVAKAKGDDFPSMDEDFCRQNGLYYRITCIISISDEEALKRAVQMAIDGEVFKVLPGTYTIDVAIDRGVVLEGSTGKKHTCVEFADELTVTASTVFKGIKFIGKGTTNTLKITGTAKPQFVGCAFEKCGIISTDSAYPLLENCEIKNAYQGLVVKDCAGVECKGCLVQNAQNIGIWIHHENQEPKVPSVFREVKSTACGQCGFFIVGIYAKPRFTACEAYENKLSGFEVKTNATPVLEQCKAYNGVQCGFIIHDGGKGTYRGCEAYGNKLSGFEVKENAAPVLEQCKAYNGETYGFYIHTSGKGTFRNCEEYGNKKGGWEIGDDCDCIIEDSNRKQNSQKVPVNSPVTATFLRATKQEGAFVKEGTTVAYIESMKMELEVKASATGSIHYLVTEGAVISVGKPIAQIS